MITPFTFLFLFSLTAPIVQAEGYYCPYTELGATENNDLVYDYYNSSDGGLTWLRLGETGFIGRSQYCAEKGDESIHFDAGEEKCTDSVGLCFWDGSSCQVNQDRVPDCFALCEAVLNGEGLPCLGGSCGSRDTIYEICELTEEPVVPQPSCRPRH